MTCPICNQKIDPSDHSEKWGPEFAHSRCVIAFTAGSAIQNAKLQDRIKRLKEAGDALDKQIGCGCVEYGPCQSCRTAMKRWTKAKETKP